MSRSPCPLNIFKMKVDKVKVQVEIEWLQASPFIALQFSVWYMGLLQGALCGNFL